MEINFIDSRGNTAKCQKYHLGDDLYECYLFDFNSAIPRRYTGNKKEIGLRMDYFLYDKVKAGFRIDSNQ